MKFVRITGFCGVTTLARIPEVDKMHVFDTCACQLGR